MAAKILICDDALFTRTLIKRMFANLDYEVCGEAKDPREAVDKYKELRPDLVIMDVIMSKTEGLEDGVAAAKEIFEIDPQAKVIMMSSLGQEEIVKGALAMGCKSFIVKPFKDPEFIETVKRVLAE